jgi:hypothetical protein
MHIAEALSDRLGSNWFFVRRSFLMVLLVGICTLVFGVQLLYAEIGTDLPVQVRTNVGHSARLIQAISPTPDGRLSASGDWKEIKLLDTGSGRLLRTFPVAAHSLQSAQWCCSNWPAGSSLDRQKFLQCRRCASMTERPRKKPG